MSTDNVETVCLAYEHLNRGDVEALVELCDDDFVMDMSERVFNPDTYKGDEGIRRFYDGSRCSGSFGEGSRVSLRFYRDRAQALEAAGLSE